MPIADFIRDDVLHPRMKTASCLVVYDPDRRYHELCLAMRSEHIRVVDTSESSLESRWGALQELREVGKSMSAPDALLVYVPAPAPKSDEQKMGDPFALYAACGAVFPDGDGDEFQSLCLRAKPDFAVDIRRVFAQQPSPAFVVIDAIGSGGMHWPLLRAALHVESARDILNALVTPNTEQTKALKEQDGWQQEAREFLQAVLGMQVKTRAKSGSALSEELWRFMLFSEFAFDRADPLPPALATVPRAPDEARPLVEELCERLRSDLRSRVLYIEKADAVEAELNLTGHCPEADDPGQRATFAFEERALLRRAAEALLAGKSEQTRQAIARSEHSVWLGKGESQPQWALIGAALALMDICDDLEPRLADRSRNLNELLDFYQESLREADRLQREFEQAVNDFLTADAPLDGVIKEARDRYRRLAEKAQTRFMQHLEASGWPPAGRLANADVFDRFVGERLKERGRKTALFLIDALRYELGVALEKQIAEDSIVELYTAYAQLPTITPVGMASLLPGARNDLTLERDNDSLVPHLAGVPLRVVSQRMDVLRKRYGDRFAEKPLSIFVKDPPQIADTVELLVLRSVEIDAHLESSPETTLGLIPKTLKLIRVALGKLRDLGFDTAIIATDHGFFLNAQAEAGDVCIKPQGSWPVNAHDRMLLGNGTADSHNIVMASERLGMVGGFAQTALPRSMAPYSVGHLYFHGGASLAEAIVPVLVARFDSAKASEAHTFRVQLFYKTNAKRITTRLPVIDVELAEELFSAGTSVEILLEAQDEAGNVVGEPRPGSDVNPATHTVALTPGQRKQIALRMEPDFEGKFTVRALNPATLAAYSSLNLETDYL